MRVTASSGSPLAACAAMAILGLACGREPGPPTDTAGTLVVGVTPQPALAGYVGSYRVTTTVDGDSPAREELPSTQGSDGTPEPFVVRVRGASGTATSEAHVLVEAFAETRPDAHATPVLVRAAHTSIVPGGPWLLRLPLESTCVAFVGAPAPTCPATQTCAAGRCVDPRVPPSDLEVYADDWARDPPDACRPAHAGPPRVELGTGQTDFLPLAEGAVLELERGPQGGHHLWIAVRFHDVHQTGALVTITATQPETDVRVPPTRFTFGLTPDEGGACKLFGLRYQLDNGSAPVDAFLGKPLDVHVEVQDPSGARAEATRRIHVGTSIRG